MAVAVAVKPPRRRTHAERMAMSPEEELELLIAEQEADDTFYVDRSQGEISFDAPAPHGEGTIADFIGTDEDGELLILLPLPASPPMANADQHGTLYGYRRLKCKCRPCTKANSTYMAAYRAQKKAQS